MMDSSKEKDSWDLVIIPRSRLFGVGLTEVLRYSDLLWLFVKRDIVTVYKQTLLGPVWYFVQPIFTTIIFAFVFGKLAKVSTDGLPVIIFYLLGITLWNYFSDSLSKTSNVFVVNQNIFGKVYFPRAIMPISIIISNLGKFFIQFFLFLLTFAYYWYEGAVTPNVIAFLFPLIVLLLAMISLGFGMLFSALTTKYRDLTFLLAFGIQLWMYMTPVIYPVSAIPSHYSFFIKLNPVAPLIESMRYGFLGKGNFEMSSLLYSSLFAAVICLAGYCAFSYVEKNFMDSI